MQLHDDYASMVRYFEDETGSRLQDFTVAESAVKEGQKFKVCCVCGSSGSGKTELVHRLVAKFPEQFRVLRQITTRQPRENEKAHYFFVSHDEYQKVYGNLVARNLAFYGNNYGTLFTACPKRVNLVVVNDNGLRDIIDDNGRYGFADIFTLGLDRNTEEAAAEEGRSHRDINKEREVLAYADFIHSFSGNDYMTPASAKEIIDGHFN